MTELPIYAKELSWLAFNERVLQEAADNDNAVIERVRFLGIFSNNLDEFFRVRVADVRRRIQYAASDSIRAYEEQLLQSIQKKVLQLHEDFERIRLEVYSSLAKKHIYILEEQQLSERDVDWLKGYFRDTLLRYLVPIFIDTHTHVAARMDEDSAYLCIQIQHQDNIRYALIEIPTHELSRFVQLPAEGSKRKKKVVLLDNIISLFLHEIFRGLIEFDGLQAFSLKMTRDAEFDVSEEIDQSVLEQMEEGLKQRIQAKPLRFVYDKAMPSAMLRFLVKRLNLSAYDAVVPGGRYRNFRDFIRFPNVGRKSLQNAPLQALDHWQFEAYPSVFSAIDANDILLYYPYHKFRHLTEMVRQAACDPQVTHIRLAIYRVAKHSRIIGSLLDAVHNGKSVSVVVELRARFDEENNIEWARLMTDAGIQVSFGIPNLKVHSKICLITRKQDDVVRQYAAIGTGNFHEHTAKVYTDFTLFTCQPAITQEVEQVFDFIEHSYKRYRFSSLLVSPLNQRERLLALIQREQQHAQQRQTAWIEAKVNNLVDVELIQALYAASQAGVKIKLIVRGMCALVPGIKGISDNIKVISIVDRFLEHPRVMAFANGGQREVYIGSADWMARNLDQRIEVSVPINDAKLQQQIMDILALHWRDTTKARVIDAEQRNHYVKRGNKRKLQSQLAIYDYLKQQNRASE
ncbi:polyphosphate kinase 1 [Idiomarina xiamenensis]|uniref:Polyphosphate kinase n=1 Tax=Idiomarina xiamenensis 10-D-4 TaxID=740709 RepID=K2LCL3_9GAMM|nr:polyphosphate kinase 1 [Idiomarina xiamenensis]EKE87625.1 polyphosphate kinase [Idiomarina xiamenensis 10-D-4]